MKKKTKLITIISASVTVILTLILSLCLVLIRPSEEFFKIKEVSLPSEELYALQTFDKQNSKQMKLTMREDVMTVLQRNVKRPSVKLLSDTFTLPNTESSVTFPSYPSWYIHNNIKDSYTQTGYYNYYKYMLLRQGMLLMQEMQEKSYGGTLTTADVYKHPGIDAQYGAVLGSDNAIVKEIIIDPTYKNLHTTGLYLPAGEIITIKVENLKAGESIYVNTQSNNSLGYSSGMPSNYFEATDKLVSEGKFDEVQISAQWNNLNNRLPYISGSFKLDTNKVYQIASPFGGAMHLNVSKTSSNAKLTFAGAVEHPHYILGTTTEEYFNLYLKNAPGPASSLDTENGIMVGYGEPMRNVSDIETLALLWHSFFAVNENFTGGAHNSNNFVCFDVHVPAGAAVHLGGGLSVCPVSWQNSAFNYESLLKNGTWGVLHEIGHGNASAYGTIWGMNGNQEGEVRNNMLIVLAYIQFLDIASYRNMETGAIAVEHGEVAHPYTTLKTYLNNNVSDFNELSYFEALSCYTNLVHSFGVDKFYELMYTYKLNPTFNSNKRADFIYRTSQVYGLDTRFYFNSMYKANIADSAFSEEQLNFLQSLKEYIPIANLYAGGIDGLKTGGTYTVKCAGSTRFDLLGKTVSLKPFTLHSVGSAKVGTINVEKDGFVSYTPPTDYQQNDEFDFFVKQENGLIHKFTVYLKLDAHISVIEAFENVDTKIFYNAEKIIAGEKPSSIISTDISGIMNYSSSNTCYVSKFSVRFPESKEYLLSFKADDKAKFELKDKNGKYNEIFIIDSVTGSYISDNSYKFLADKDKVYDFRILNLNIGGNGYASIGVLNGETFTNLPKNWLYTPYLNHDNILNFKENERTQMFYTSKKLTALNSKSEQVYSVSNSNLFVDSRFEFKTPEGRNILQTNKKDARAIIRFSGTNISLYSTKDSTYGSANIILDGNFVKTVSLKNDVYKQKQLIFESETLENGIHTIEIITNSEEVFNLEYIGLNFGASLINAPNIYLESSLIWALVSFVLLFVLAVTFILLIYFVPNFRKLVMPKKADNVKSIDIPTPPEAKPIQEKQVKTKERKKKDIIKK